MDLPPNPPEPPAPILLPPHCSIDAAASLRDALLAIEAPAGVAIDAGAVETIGQAVMQVLLAARNDAVADGRIPAEIVAVGADKDCAGLERARAAGVEDFLVAPSSYSDRPSWNRALQSAVAEREPDLVILAARPAMGARRERAVTRPPPHPGVPC